MLWSPGLKELLGNWVGKGRRASIGRPSSPARLALPDCHRDYLGPSRSRSSRALPASALHGMAWLGMCSNRDSVLFSTLFCSVEFCSVKPSCVSGEKEGCPQTTFSRYSFSFAASMPDKLTNRLSFVIKILFLNLLFFNFDASKFPISLSTRELSI